ncbi:MAG: transglycosylase SLT domain-containing protein [Bdellovibrionaceae bacterium]|nr:transglycosylase SLT domain-containing protein [Pseudobdellovibrionaceae bacterium]MDW8190960.1 transglycosylase SLT domain-containing protein [Pseudobdellovibrionaceae bacterium]
MHDNRKSWFLLVFGVFCLLNFLIQPVGARDLLLERYIRQISAGPPADWGLWDQEVQKLPPRLRSYVLLFAVKQGWLVDKQKKIAWLKEAARYNGLVKEVAFERLITLACEAPLQVGDCTQALNWVEKEFPSIRREKRLYQLWLSHWIQVLLHQNQVTQALHFFKRNRRSSDKDQTWQLDLYYQILSRSQFSSEWCQYYKEWMLNRRRLADFAFTPQMKDCRIPIQAKLERIRFLISNSFEDKAKNDILAFLELYSLPSHQQHFIWAEFYYRSHYFEKALEHINFALNESPLEFEYYNLKANALSRMGRLVEAAQVYQEIYEKFLNRSKRQQALFDKGFIYFQAQKFSEAESTFLQLLKEYPNSHLVTDVMWYLGWMAFLRKDYLMAIDFFRKILRRNGPEKNKVKYWLARALWEEYRYGEATRYFDELKNEKDDGIFNYYSLLSENFLNKRRPSGLFIKAVTGEICDVGLEFSLPHLNKSLLWHSDDADFLVTSRGAKKKVREDQVRLPANKRLRPLKQLKINESRVIDDYIYLFLIEEDQLAVEILKNFFSVSNHPVEILKELHQFEEFDEAARLAESLIGRHFSLQQVREFVFPKAFPKIVVEYAQRWGVDPRFIWSVMRAESYYSPEVESPVLAKGLMQLMPYTAEKMARIAKVTEYKNPEDLFKIDINVHLGVAYLARLQSQFQGNLPLIAAAYNAGPHRVQTWLHRFGYRDFDEFIELIPFRETRFYVKKVMSFYYHYGGFFDFLRGIEVDERVRVPMVRESWDDIM